MTEKLKGDPFPGLGRPEFARRIEDSSVVIEPKVKPEEARETDHALKRHAAMAAHEAALSNPKGRPGRPKKPVKDQPWVAAGKSKTAYYRDRQKGKA